MKAIVAASAATLFATSASAIGIYKDTGFGDGDPDVNPSYVVGAEKNVKSSGNSAVIFVGPASTF